VNEDHCSVRRNALHMYRRFLENIKKSTIAHEIVRRHSSRLIKVIDDIDRLI
jgi:hypothetical protein